MAARRRVFKVLAGAFALSMGGLCAMSVLQPDDEEPNAEEIVPRAKRPYIDARRTIHRAPTKLLPTAASVEIRQPTSEEILKRIEGCWYESEILDSGRWGYGGNEQYGWRFGPEGAENWTLTGELQTSSYGAIRVDTSVTPWRFDVIDKQSSARNKKHSVWAGVIEFQGENLVWTSHGDWSLMTPGERFPTGPSDFTSTKANQQIRRVLKRCEYLQTQFP